MIFFQKWRRFSRCNASLQSKVFRNHTNRFDSENRLAFSLLHSTVKQWKGAMDGIWPGNDYKNVYILRSMLQFTGEKSSSLIHCLIKPVTSLHLSSELFLQRALIWQIVAYNTMKQTILSTNFTIFLLRNYFSWWLCFMTVDCKAGWGWSYVSFKSQLRTPGGSCLSHTNSTAGAVSHKCSG